MTVSVERAGPVTTIIHDRPEARNAMDPASAEALVEAFLAFEADPEARVAVLYGAGGAFCAGFDLAHAATLAASDAPASELAFPEEADAPVPRGPMGPTRLELDKPVIAAIAGPAVAGGLELALWCDLRVMEENAYFGVYCRRWGVPLIDGGTIRLPRLIGEGRALDLILTGRKVEAAEAIGMGLCERIVARGQARQAAEALAADIARFPQVCMRADRRSVRRHHGLPVAEGLKAEWNNSIHALAIEGVSGAARFKDGKGRHGNFSDL